MMDDDLGRGQKDWSVMPADMLCEILRHLTMVDHVRFSAVCKSWQSAAEERPNLPALEPPWLLIPDPNNPQRVNFLSPSGSKKRCHVKLPVDDFPDRIMVGSSCGWLITNTLRGRVFMLHPLSGIEIELPSITTFPDVKPCPLDSQGREVSDPESLSDLVVYDPAPHGGRPNYVQQTMLLSKLSMAYFYKAIIIPARSTHSSTIVYGFAVVAILLNFRLAIFHSGDAKWTIVRPPQYIAFMDLNFVDELIYAIDRFGKLFTLDIFTATIQEFSSEQFDFEDLHYFVNNSLNLVAMVMIFCLSSGSQTILPL